MNRFQIPDFTFPTTDEARYSFGLEPYPVLLYGENGWFKVGLGLETGKCWKAPGSTIRKTLRLWHMVRFENQQKQHKFLFIKEIYIGRDIFLSFAGKRRILTTPIDGEAP